MGNFLNDWAGYLLITVSYLIIWAFPQFRKDHRLLVCGYSILTLHHVLALINAYVFTLPATADDPVVFQRDAVEWASGGEGRFEVGSGFYVQFLGIFYRALGPSHLLGEELSILALAISMGVLISFIDLLKVEFSKIPLLLLVGFLPTLQVLGSVTLREPFQMLFFMLCVYCGIIFHRQRKALWGFLCLFSAFAMGLFHHGLILYAFFLVPCLLLWPVSSGQRLSKRGRGPIFAVGLFALGAAAFFLLGTVEGIEGLGAVKSFVTGDCITYVQDYRNRLLTLFKGRADYGVPLETSSLGAFVSSNFKIFVYYLFAPFPWQISRLVDIYGFLESLLRFGLLFFCFAKLSVLKGPDRRIWLLLLLVYFSLSYLWALGTANYGTSIRHHLLTNWLIVVMGGPGLISFLQKILKKMGLGMFRRSCGSE